MRNERHDPRTLETFAPAETPLEDRGPVRRPAPVRALPGGAGTAEPEDGFWTDDLLSEAETCTEAEIEEAVKGFLTGDLTLAQLEGLSARDLYQVADMGYDLFSEGRLEEARRIFEGLYCYNPFDAYFHGALGAIYHRTGELQSAYEHYLSAVELYEGDIHAWTNLGEVALELSARHAAAGEADEAEERFVLAAEAFARAIALDPEGTDDAALRARALVHLTVGSMRGAEAR